MITNDHVVGNATTVKIYFAEYDAKGELLRNKDGYLKKTGISGKVLVKEQRCDLALVQLDSLPPNVEPLPIAKTSVQPGQGLHTVGNPGASDSLFVYSPGQVRQVYHRKWIAGDEDGNAATYDAMIVESTTPTNSGDSGGPLVNDRCTLVGVVHGSSTVYTNFSIFIDISEVRTFVEKYFKSIGQTWIPEPEANVNPVPLAQISDWVKRLTHEDVAQRVKAAQMLGSMGPEGTLAFRGLFAALKDSEAIVRNAVSDALEKIPPHKDDADMLTKACQDEAEPAQVRLQAVRSLGKLGGFGKSAMPVLLTLAGGANDELRQASLTAAAGIGAQADDVSTLLKLIKGPNPDTRRKAGAIIGRMGEQGQPAVSDLTGLLKAKDKSLRLEAARTLATLGMAAKDASKALNEVLKQKDVDLDVSIQAARALGRMGEPKAAVPFFTSNLKKANVEQKKEIAISLGEIGYEARGAAKDLVVLFDDDATRSVVQEALTKIGKDALPAVLNKLGVMLKSNSSPKARLAGIHCVRDIGQATNDVGIALQFLAFNDPDPANRAAALQVGKLLFGESFGENPKDSPKKGGPNKGGFGGK